MHEPSGAKADVGRWLALLRDGSEEEQQRARTELGLILEARGLLDDAAEAYARNVEDGVTDRRPYERLAALARARGDRETEARALRGLADLLAPTPTPPPAPVLPPPQPEAAPLIPTPVAETVPEPALPSSPPDEVPTDELPVLAVPATEIPDRRSTLDVSDAGTQDEVEAPDRDDEAETADLPFSAAHRTVPDGDVQAAAPASDEPPAMPRLDEQPAAPSPAEPDPAGDRAPAPTLSQALTMSQAPEQPQMEAAPALAPPDTPKDRSARHPGRDHDHDRAGEDPGVALHHVLEVHPEETRHHPEPAPARAGGSGIARTLVTLAMLVPVLAVVFGAAVMWPAGSGAPQPTTPSGGPGGIVPVASATSVELRLIAGTRSPILSPTVTPLPSPSLTPTVTPASLTARCADAGLRFPETNDPEGAVRAAYREYMARQGVAIDPASTPFDGLGVAYASRHNEVVAGWVAVTLQRERRGLAPFPLVDYVASDVIVATGPNAYQLRATVSPQGWSEMRAWPADTCEGAFMRNPANAHWVDLMQVSVGDITWALPTRTPAR